MLREWHIHHPLHPLNLPENKKRPKGMTNIIAKQKLRKRLDENQSCSECPEAYFGIFDIRRNFEN